MIFHKLNSTSSDNTKAVQNFLERMGPDNDPNLVTLEELRWLL